MYKATLYLGLNNKDTKKQILATKDLTNIANIVISKYYDGATITESQGLWQGDTENTLVITIFTDTLTHIKTLSNDLKQVFNQETVLYTIEKPMEVNFI